MGIANCVSEGGGMPVACQSGLDSSCALLYPAYSWRPCAMLLGVLDRSLRPSALPGLMGGKNRKEVDILWFVWTIWASLGGQLHSIIPGVLGREGSHEERP